MNVDISPYLASNLIPETIRQDAQAKITTIQGYNFLQEVVTSLDLHQLGWNVGCRYGASALHGFTFDALAKGTSEAVFELSSNISNHANNARFFVLHDKYRFELCNIGSVPPKSEAYLQSEYYLLAVSIDFVRRAFDQSSYFPSYVRFRSADFGHEPKEFKDLKMNYEQPYFSVDIPLAWYRKPRGKKTPVSEQPDPDLTQVLNALLAPHLSQQMLSIVQLSTITATPVRNLQRQLEKEGTNYRKLVLDLRMKTAEVLLRQATGSMEQISLAVGYRQTTHFIRAFKSWQGTTPLQYRLTRK